MLSADPRKVSARAKKRGLPQVPPACSPPHVASLGVGGALAAPLSGVHPGALLPRAHAWRVAACRVADTLHASPLPRPRS